MSTVLGGLMARALWTCGVSLEPLNRSRTELAMAQSHCSAKEIKEFRASPAYHCAKDFLLAAQNESAGAAPALHVIVDDAAKVHRLKGIRCICTRLKPAAGGLLKVTGCDGVFVLTPAQHYVVRARDLDFVGCCLLAMELCGSYLLRPDLPQGFQTMPKPLSSTPALARQIGRNRGMPGTAQALRALFHACDGSASPMESALVLLLVLPASVGGYGLPLPQLNPKVDITTASSRLLDGVRSVRPDVLWPDAKVGLEYDSRSFHTQNNADHDRARRTALQTAGIEPISITPQLVSDVEAFDEVAHLVGERLGASVKEPNPRDREILRQRLLGSHPIW